MKNILFISGLIAISSIATSVVNLLSETGIVSLLKKKKKKVL